MAKHLGILVAPNGDEFYETYGPMTTLRDRATRFETQRNAIGAANQRYGRHGDAFWNSERASQQKAAAEYRDWKVRTEEVGDDDLKREGHFVMDYASGRTDDRLYAHGDPTGATTWSPDLEGSRLWPRREDAVAAIRTMPVREGRHYAVDTY
jgi:hypothetical protein